MKYLLLYWLITNPTLPATTGSAEFEDEQSCRGALTRLERTWPNPYRAPLGFCTEKVQVKREDGCIIVAGEMYCPITPKPQPQPEFPQ